MSTGTALVNARTPNAAPQDQRGGTYAYTPPEVIGYLNGETLTNAEYQLVTRFFNGVLPTITPPESEPALADIQSVVSGRWFVSGEEDKREIMTAPYAGKLKSKAPKQAGGTLQDAVVQLATLLPDDSAYVLLCKLADRFNLEIE